MLVEQRLIALGYSLVDPLACSRLRIDAYISLCIVEVGIVVGLVVGVGCDDEHHLVGTLNGNFSVMIVYGSALCHRLHTYAILHIIIVETGVPQEFVVAFGYHLALRNGVLGIRKHEVLHSLTRSLEAYSHHIGRIADEVFACIADAVLGKRHHSQSRVDRERAAIACHAHLAQSGLNVQFACCSETTEAERFLCICLVGHRTVEVFACKHFRLLQVVVDKSLTYVLDYTSRLLVDVPVVACTLACVRSATP